MNAKPADRPERSFFVLVPLTFRESLAVLFLAALSCAFVGFTARPAPRPERGPWFAGFTP